MISIENIKELQQRVQTLGNCIGVEAKRAEVASKTEKTLAADFWDDPKEAERRLYRVFDCEIAFNLLVYKEEDFLLLEKDETSYAYSIMSKGRVLYG